MEDKLVTIIVLPRSKAEQYKNQLQKRGVECTLEDLPLDEDASSNLVKVNIPEDQVKQALPVMDKFTGEKAEQEKEKIDESARHILVPIDFSPVSLKVSKMAFNIASHLNLNLVFMHCYGKPVMHSVPYSDVYVYDAELLQVELQEDNAHKNVKQFKANLSEDIGEEKWEKVNSEFLVKAGHADEEILAYAHEKNSQLIVIGTGQTQQENVMGSVTADIIYNAEVPVLVIPEETQVKDIAEIRRVLYATNFDDKDFAAIDNLITLLKPFDVQVVCVHVGREKGKEWETAKLEGMKEMLKEKYADKEFACHLVIDKKIPEAIEKFIQEENIDILSLTTHKRNMISRLFNPSFARKMVFHTHTPLLVFHA